MTKGRFRESVNFQRRSTASDGYGNQVASWADMAGLVGFPARIAPMRGGEDVIASKLQANGLVEIKVNSCVAIRGVTATDRIVDTRTGEVYNIRYIENKDERNRYVTFVCEYGVADG